MAVHHIECESCCAVSVVAANEGDVDRHLIQQNDLASRVVRSLYAHGVSTAGAIEVHASFGTVTVRGQVCNRHVKRVCLECCRHVAGVNKLIDQLEAKTLS
jgi:osmotically-inducible protein OsmY